jgi:hypothetical protein
MSGNPRLLLLMTFLTALVVGGIAALANRQMVGARAPPVLHGIGTVAVVSGVFKRLEQGEKPDPVTDSRLDDEQG